jgi:hypothetical protein
MGPAQPLIRAMPVKTTKLPTSKSLHEEEAGDESSYQGLVHSIRGIAESLNALNRQAVREYEPIVESILRSRSRDTGHIEHTLDGLLGFCGYEPALVLFKKLCRHYWEIDPAATARQIHAYREFWDSDEINETGELVGGAA